MKLLSGAVFRTATARFFSARRWIHDSPTLRQVGFLATRALTSRPVRRTVVGRRVYAGLYLLGKRLGEAPEQRLFRKRLAPGMTVIDLGANVGFYTELFSNLVGASGRVYAFEPNPFSASVLRERVRSFRVPNVRVEAVAVGEKAGTATLYCSRRDCAESRTFPLDRKVPREIARVPVVSLDSYCEAHGIDRIDVAKIDVEGCEVSALRGMRRLLASGVPSALFIEFSPKQLRGAGSSPEAFWQILTESGYAGFALNDGGGDLTPITDTAAFTEAYAVGHPNIWAERATA